MAYRTTVKHKEIAAEVAASARNLASETRDIMNEKLAPFLLEGETMPDAGLLQELLSRFLVAQGQDLLAADDSYSREVRDHHELHWRCLESMAEVRRRLRDVRYAADRLFGAETCKILLGTRDFTTRRAAILVGLARKAAQALREPQYYFEPEPAAGLAFSSSRLADELERASGALARLADQQLKEQRKRRQAQLGVKEERLASTKEAISGAAAVLKGFYLFTGNSFHARRLRPRPARRSTVRPEGAGDAPTFL